MPSPKRWFPVSQEVNRDPQLWDLCRRYGDRALRIWLELLAIADRLDGTLPDPSPDLRRALADASRTSGQTVVKVWRTLQEWSWITSSSPVRVANYWKYHRRREPISHPLGSQVGSPPSFPSEPSSYSKKNKIPPISPKGFELFWEAYPNKVGKRAASKAWDKAKLNGKVEIVLEAVEKQKTWPRWLKDGGQFIPNPATWLNQGRWEDERQEEQNDAGREPEAWKSLKAWSKRRGLPDGK